MAQQKSTNRTIQKNHELIAKGERNTIQELVAKGNQWDRGKQSFADKVRQQEAQKNSNRPLIEKQMAERKIEQSKMPDPKKVQVKQMDKNNGHGRQ
jgi:hypothetical protein